MSTFLNSESRVGELDELRENVRQLGAVVQHLLANTRTVPYMHDAPFSILQDDVSGQPAMGFADRSAIPDADAYRRFEDIFRGPADRVAELQRPYLKYLRDLRGPVLDVGCGRGEMLELLADEGIPAIGVDLDAGMVAACRETMDTEVHCMDAVDYLRSRPDHSLGAIFAAQVIEHMPYSTFVEYLREAVRVLVPGGVWIAETVNPHVATSLKCFWVDMTHQHPIFPEVCLSYAWMAGFDRGYLVHPTGTGRPDVDRLSADSYAVVAYTARD